MTRASAFILSVACALALAACGGGGEASTGAPATSTPAAATSATGPTAPTGVSGPTASVPAPEPQPSSTSAPATTTPKPPDDPKGAGAGDEEPIRQPVRFEVGGADVKPSSVSVEPFLTIELELVNQGSTALLVRLVGTDTTIQLAPGATATRRIAGLKKGLYTLSVNDGAQVGSIIVGDNVGP